VARKKKLPHLLRHLWLLLHLLLLKPLLHQLLLLHLPKLLLLLLPSKLCLVDKKATFGWLFLWPRRAYLLQL
jgi:hypothetical protein